MSYQAYLDDIAEKTGKPLEDFRGIAQAKGLAGPEGVLIKATQITDWLMADHGLGAGPAIAIATRLKGKTG